MTVKLTVPSGADVAELLVARTPGQMVEAQKHMIARQRKRLASMGQKDYASILDAKGKFNGGTPQEVVMGLDTASRKGSEMADWPEDLRVREFPKQESVRA